jgi:hypothetical protein
MELIDENTPPNVTRRGRRRRDLTQQERAEAEELMARIMAPRPQRPAVPYLEQFLGQQGPPPNVTQRRQRRPRAPRRETVAPRAETVAPGIPGVAFEIHNAFTKFQSIKNAYLALIKEPDTEYGNIFNYIYRKYSAVITEIFPNEVVELAKRQQLKKVINKIKNSTFDEYKNLIGKTVSFVSKQDTNFKEQYILAFLNDTCNAYATGNDRTSCVKGIIERIVLSVGSTVEILCMEQCENETYQKLNALMNPKFKVEDVAIAWFESAQSNEEILKLDKVGRKNNFIEYLKSESIRLDHKGGLIPENILAEINAYAVTMDYAFKDKDLQFGGVRKLRKTKKARKYRKTRKARK